MSNRTSGEYHERFEDKLQGLEASMTESVTSIQLIQKDFSYMKEKQEEVLEAFTSFRKEVRTLINQSVKKIEEDYVPKKNYYDVHNRVVNIKKDLNKKYESIDNRISSLEKSESDDRKRREDIMLRALSFVIAILFIFTSFVFYVLGVNPISFIM